MKNTWPRGYRHALFQDDHERWNSYNYPGTRQLCSECEQPTGNCEDDSLFLNDRGPLCKECWVEIWGNAGEEE